MDVYQSMADSTILGFSIPPADFNPPTGFVSQRLHILPTLEPRRTGKDRIYFRSIAPVKVMTIILQV